MTNIRIMRAFDELSKELFGVTRFLQGYLTENFDDNLSRELNVLREIKIDTTQNNLSVKITDLFPSYVPKQIEGLTYQNVIWLLRLLDVLEEHSSKLPGYIGNYLRKSLDEAREELYDFTEYEEEPESDLMPMPEHELGD